MRQATNAALMRQNNQKLILDLIRRQPISRADLAEAIGLTRAAVTMIIDPLIERGVVVEADTAEESRVGRKRILLDLDRKNLFALGVYLNRGECRAGVVDFTGRVLVEERCLTDHSVGQETAIGEILSSLRRMRDGLKLNQEKIVGIGIAAPGPLDYRSGVILNPPKFKFWHNAPIAASLSEGMGLPAWLENVANATALDEQYFGVARELSDYAAILIDDGIGSGVVTGGRLYRGARGLGNELGHTSIQFNGRRCECGNSGCLEKYASLPALLERTPFDSWQAVIDGLPSPDANRVLDAAVQYLGTAFVSLFNLYDLDCVILKGAMQYKAEALLQPLNLTLHQRIIHPSRETGLVISGCYSNPVRAAAIPAIHAFFQSGE